ncbi:hypothetical protein C943_03671 [Mariniradius saccharolyticus AK6]|uniref:Uncharacterized protein n=1 Tax=Mariniradius saccharolyticus AK6 TaxID=1239962 RepID=M7Y147_9BACT|nr:hypothetical protein C943_03671 [Mariniradius saccharolyticus AK6]
MEKNTIAPKKNFLIKQFFAYPIFSFKYAFFDFVTKTES